MKKISLLILPLVLALVVGMIGGAYGRVGHWLYANVTDLEASLYGFEQRAVDIGEMKLALYSNNNPGKPVIVMLHGYSADKDVWPRFAKHFVDDYQVIIPDMAGHGDTGFDASWDYSMPAQAKRLAALLDKLDIAQAHVIGNSMGGFLTATFAIAYPQRTLSATMVDPAGVMSPEPSDMFKMLNQGHNPFLIHNRAEFDSFYAMTMAQPPFLPGMVLEAMSDKYIERRSELEKIFADFHSSDYLEEKLADLKAPAMLWWGDKDRLLHVSSVSVWEAGVPQLKTHIFNGIGHMPMVEVASEAADLYRDFLQQVPAQIAAE
ncbi:alpha/beta fold hydrolase [Thalassolituus alkanivorans]|uniref:alpha/beta fold hydrolase n=1 Tax=Thalassolituus alkanivorans TaxID=2881055 RepID=UPI001E4A8089|nr:alpha/beta fold hydrolase [Thalassolituus alkanivorans]MCB2388385.1 alpha/beta fold hydrolase [Thalassolituus alkanivorans]MCB2423897.1 alpha/beta fold hydrolase [Thalassolituus alkanivorans]